MGYETEFNGSMKIEPPLQGHHLAYLQRFCETRRMKRREPLPPDPLREAVGLPLGIDGGFFVGSDALYGQDFEDESVIDHNRPPDDQLGLWCGWDFEDHETLTAQPGKNYSYQEWLSYLETHFLHPWGYKLSGGIQWRGEDWEDVGTMVRG